MDKSLLLGFITREGSSNSHTAILARSMNIPALIQCKEIQEDWDGKMAVVDGYNACVYVDPTPDLLESLKKRQQEDQKKLALLAELKGKPNTTLDGKTVQVFANIGGMSDVGAVQQNDAGGVGLFRTEFVYLNCTDYPTEEYQFEAYKQVLESLAPKKVVVRTCDIGADKTVDYMKLDHEDNPALGYRAIRICLTRKDFFKTQLRALLRASAYGNMSIMFPMITSLRELQDAKAGKPGALDLPDLFSAHPSDASALGIETLVDWNDWFTAEDMAAYVPGFVQDGIIEGRQVVFPVSKSTQLIFLNGSQYARFAADTGAQLSTLATWDGFFEMAAAYRQWSQGKPFCALDYPLRLVELNALEQGSGELYKDCWYDLTNEAFRTSWMEFARGLVQGDILISDLYSNTQVMTGETLAGLGSSAAILYYNDFVTYPDNTTEPTDLLLAPLPHAAGTTTPLMPQAGVGLCAFKTTDQKAEAAAVFLRWFTEQQRNLEFAADTGYMPVSSAAFDAIADYPFEQQSYQRLYDVYNEMRLQNTPLSEPGIVGYHAKAKALYDSLRQKDYPQRLANGETLEALTEETWQLLCDNA